MPPSDKKFSAREVAGLVTAIAWLRNELIWVSSPNAEIDLEGIGRLIESTSLEKIEEVLAAPRGSLSLDCKKFITAREEHLIAGKNPAYFDESNHEPA